MEGVAGRGLVKTTQQQFMVLPKYTAICAHLGKGKDAGSGRIPLSIDRESAMFLQIHTLLISNSCTKRDYLADCHPGGR